MSNFKTWLENSDIFGFSEKRIEVSKHQDFLEKPIRFFNSELMMDILGEKRVGLLDSNSFFINEMQWGEDVGSVKVNIDTGYTFYFKRMIPDLEGANCWITKKILQLNRQGYGGYEDAVAGEVHDHIVEIFNQPLDTPLKEFYDLETLVNVITRKVKKVAKDILVYERTIKLDDNNYTVVFNIKAGGVESPDHNRIEKNMSNISFNEESGMIKVVNYNVESPVGGSRKWALSPVDLDLNFCPSQDVDEIAECVGVHYKYY